MDPPACGPRGHLVLRARAKLHPRLVRQGVVERVEKFLTSRTRFVTWKLSLIPRMPGASGRIPTSLRCRRGPGHFSGCLRDHHGHCVAGIESGTRLGPYEQFRRLRNNGISGRVFNVCTIPSILTMAYTPLNRLDALSSSFKPQPCTASAPTGRPPTSPTA